MLNNMRTSIFLFVILVIVGCSSSKELEGNWIYKDRDWKGNFTDKKIELKITNTTITTTTWYEYYSPSVETKSYKVFEKGPSYIVIKTDDNSLMRFDIDFTDTISYEGKVFSRF